MVINDPSKTVGAYVKERPALSKVFERYGIDYCCGGKRPLLDVCQEKGVSVDELLRSLEQAAANTLTGEDLDWQTMTLTEMVEHIDERHHRYLYEVMPRLSQMANKVARVHGDKDARLAELASTFDTLQAELNIHMQKEERVLFPYCRQLAKAESIPDFHCGPISNPICVMEMEHDHAGALLVQMRTLSDGYTPPEWACNTYRALLDGLAEMEADIHQHIHEENNILFPQALEIAASLEKDRQK